MTPKYVFVALLVATGFKCVLKCQSSLNFQTLVRGDVLYENTMEHLEKMGISLDAPKSAEENEDEETEESTPTGSLAAADCLNRFSVSQNDCIEADVMDSTFTGEYRNSGKLRINKCTSHLSIQID